MKVKIFDESHEKDLEVAINKFLSKFELKNEKQVALLSK